MRRAAVQRLGAVGAAGLALALALSGCEAERAAGTPAAATTATAAPSSTPTQPRAAAPTDTPAATSTGTTTASPTATSTPAPRARRLTEGGCCAQPGWSPDGSQVWYVDRPNAAAPGGLWGVAVEGGEPQLITDRLGVYSADRTLLAYPEGGQTIIERLDSGERWAAPSAGRAIAFAPDGQQIAWTIASSTVNFDRRMVEIWVARVDGSEARKVAELRGGGLGGWLPDSQSLLVSGRIEDSDNDGPAQRFFGVLGLADNIVRQIVTAQNLRGASLSPDGGWLLYTVAFSGNPAEDGHWVVPVAGGDARRLDLYGAVRWRSEGRLLMIPLEWEEAGLRVVEVEAATGAVRPLTDPTLTALPIAGGDWALSPDGRRLVFVSTEDHNLWVLELPE